MFKKQNAMTLLEIIIVVVVMAILTAGSFIAMPSINSLNLEADAKKMVSDFWLVREVAATSHTDYCIRFDRNSYTVYSTACGAAGNFFKQESLISTINSPAAPFDLTWYGFNRLPFRLGGMAYSPASSSNQLTLGLSLQGRSRTIQVFELTGYVKLN